jgi:lysophospholipase
MLWLLSPPLPSVVSIAFNYISFNTDLRLADSIAVERDASSEIFAARALPNSPSGGYAPAIVDCPPNRPTIRDASGLSANETAWLPLRRQNTIAPMKDFLSRMNISGFDAVSYINGIQNDVTALPNIAIAASGGGYRALINGAGFLAAADSRTTNSTGPGQIGGLLQSATYVAGLSGGSWLVGSIFTNNFSSVETLRDGSKGSSVWQFGKSILEGPNDDGIQVVSTVDYWTTILHEVEAKQKAGFNASLTDYWGRALSFQLVNSTDGGPAFTFSSIAEDPNFISGSIPMPLIVADSRSPGTQIVSLNSTLFEINPFELGSWDPTTFAFAPLRYIGSNFSGGVVPHDGKCVEGFDQAGYVMGTSSTLFNQFLLQINGTSLPSFIETAVVDILTDLGNDQNDIAQYQPNPFLNFNNDTNGNAQSVQLTLTDGGEDLQNIPLNPLIQPLRNVDVIFAIDSSADVNNWPNGTSLMATYQRSLNNTIENGTAFPSIPDVNTFVNLGLNNGPTFFGCDAGNLTGPSPLIVYVPNAPYNTQSNFSTFTLSYTDEVRNEVIQNGYNVATQGNGTLDSEWPACVACAVLSRSFTRTKTTVPSACTDCFNRYCWNGTTNYTVPNNYLPEFRLNGTVGGKNAATGANSGLAFSLFAAVAVAAFLV